MFRVLIFALLTFRIFAEKSTEDEVKTEDDNVLILNVTNFDTVVEENELLLVVFYAPWCKHSQRVAPEYSQAATQLKEDGSKVKLAKVDSTVELKLADRFLITDYPTFKFFRNGIISEYTGGHRSQDFVTWLKKKSGPQARDLKGKEAVAAIKKEADIVVIGFFKDQKSKNAKEFLMVADKFEDLLFGITSDADVFTDHKLTNDGVVLFKKSNDEYFTYYGELNETAITSFIHENQLPLVIELKQDILKKVFASDVKKHAVLFLKKEGNDKILKDFAEVAKEFKGEFLFIYIDTATDDNIRILNFFALTEDSLPSLRLVTLIDRMKRYLPLSEGVDKPTIKKLIQDYFDGKLKRHLLSEEIPEGWDTKPVKHLVSKTFKEVVFNKNKAALVMFVAPWCGHCTHIVPMLEDLAKSYKQEDNIVIAKIDSTGNELEDLDNIVVFPTFKYFPRNSDQIIDYKGEESFDAFRIFLNSDGKEVIPKAEEQEETTDEEAIVEEEKKEAEPEKKDKKEKVEL